MLEKYTDLALESHELHAERGEDDGIILREYAVCGCKVTQATVLPGGGEKRAGKPAGKYITVETGRFWLSDGAEFENAANAVAAELKKLLPQGAGCVLAACLGNRDITADSVGPRTAEKLLVTRHLRDMAPELYSKAGFGELAAVAPGVLGQTGIESAAIVEGVCRMIRPKCVVVIDSLASRRLERLCTTVQISDSGISPGSGVFNRRAELSGKTLGAPVVSLGVPTVVDAATLALDLFDQSGAKLPEDAAEKLAHGGGGSMFVTPKDSDVSARENARLLAFSINSAVHGIKICEMGDYMR
ncbi:MAG: GPR endopeptidase [Clostridia bacterium]|nr:GPR endopeptidase [Clostridia bacterium]MBR5746427.1 GPR endopeptidase [Clostridia bacterium]